MSMPEPRPAKLSKIGKKIQRMIGIVRYMTSKMSDGKQNVLAHRLSCVMSYPPNEAEPLAKLAILREYMRRNDGITYSADHASHVIEGSIAMGFLREEFFHAAADCTWGDRNLYGILLMMNGGALVSETKKMILVDSSTEGEGIASSKAAEIVIVAQQAARGMGIQGVRPTVIRTDNASSLRIASSIKSSQRAAHALRRYRVLQQRVAEGDVKLEWCSDGSNPSDYLTKWISKKKADESIAYASGKAARVAAAVTEAIESR